MYITSTNSTYSRPTWAEINLSAIKYNLGQIRRFIETGVELMPVVKANAYGHGIYPVSRALVENGINYLSVATMDEALTLRKNDINVSVLVMGAILKEEIENAVENDITITLCSYDILDYIAGHHSSSKIKAHIKIDTGMGRLGIWHEEAEDFIKKVYDTKNIELEGIFTHFSSAGRDKMYTSYQIKSFEDLLSKDGLY